MVTPTPFWSPRSLDCLTTRRMSSQLFRYIGSASYPTPHRSGNKPADLPSPVRSPSSTVRTRREWGRVVHFSAQEGRSQHSIPRAGPKVPSIALWFYSPSKHAILIQALRKLSFIFQKAAASALVLSVDFIAAALWRATKIVVPRRGGYSIPLPWSGVVRHYAVHISGASKTDPNIWSLSCVRNVF